MSAELVGRIKAELEAKGYRWQSNENAFEITARVAWALRGQGAQLIVKRPEQNGAWWNGVRYSHDAIAFSSGWIDCLVGAGPPDNINGPTWGATGTDMSATLAAPFDLDAGAPVEPVDPPLPPPPPPPTDFAVLARAIRDLAEQVDRAQRTIMDDLARIKALQQREYSGSLLGYTFVLKPVPPKKK